LNIRLWAAACLCAGAPAAEPPPWVAVQNGRFEVYSQSESAARNALGQLERLRSLAERQMGWRTAASHRVRVIGFRSEEEYLAYRPKPVSDGFYAGSLSRDYIALPGLDAAQAGALAHEYAHALIHSSGQTPPVWLNEGLAEVFAAAGRAATEGTAAPARLQLLRRRPWLPLDEIVSARADAPLFEDRGRAEMFYAESWLLTEMLARAPGYATPAAGLLGSIGAAPPGGKALELAYGKPLAVIGNDLRAWLARRPRQTPVSGGAEDGEAGVETRAVPAFDMQLVLADLLVTSQQLDRAEALYAGLARQAPQRPEAFAGLGVIAMARGKEEDARRRWKRALELGLADGDICYRYAALLDGAGVAGSDLRAALERTLELRPDLDDARWRLALAEENEGRDAAALAQLRAMKTIAPERAHAYWCTVADAELGLGHNGEARQAAARALSLARTEEERARAARLDYAAQTHLAVQFRSDASGKQELVTTRAPNDAAEWNPFVEPGDDMRRVSGALQEVDCGAGGIQIVLQSGGARLRLAIPNPGRVRMVRGPAELTCGAQTPVQVTVDYAAGKMGQADGVARGIEFQ